MINLAPPEIKKRRGVKSLAYTIAFLYVIVASIVILGAVGLATYSYIAKVSLASKQTQLDDLVAQKKKHSQLATQAAFVQDRLSGAAKYQSSSDWNKVLSTIAASTPTDVTLTDIKISAEASKPPAITITGSSESRRSIILFNDKLGQTSPFSSSSISTISDAASGDNQSFTFSVSAGLGKTAEKQSP